MEYHANEIRLLHTMSLHVGCRCSEKVILTLILTRLCGLEIEIS